MFVFDPFKRSDPHLKVVAGMFACGLLVLAAALWWVQIVSTRDYQAHFEMQTYRTVRIPAVRGKILDRNGVVLAENRPAYTVSLYLDELREPIHRAYGNELSRAREILKRQVQAAEQSLHRALTKQEARSYTISAKEKEILQQNARYEVASNLVVQIGGMLGLALTLDRTNFARHSLALPYPVCTNLTPAQVAVFEEQCGGLKGVDLELQSVRIYPHHSNAAHVLGSVHRDDSSIEGEDASFSYRLPDYSGLVGIEAGCDKALHGMAGVKSVMVNNMGFRQTENVWSPAAPGQNVVLTIDLATQQKTEKALQGYQRAAAVAMDVQTGDILAMASCPTFDPNDSVQGFPPGEKERRANLILKPEINRATQGIYAPGSIFKTLIGLACLEAGLDPHAQLHNPGEIYLGKHGIHDLAPPGDYDFYRALSQSSNTYFISNGMKAGIERIIALGEELHLGERAGIRQQTHQEQPGIYPDLKQVRSASWFEGDTANLCIGQGKMAVTPLQMAVMASAIANGGKVLWPRLVARIEPPETAPTGETNYFEAGHIRDLLSVSPASLKVVRDAMYGDVQDPSGTGHEAFIPGYPICGKTGTAQVMDQNNKKIGDTTWFLSFAPYEQPRYAVLVMVEIEVNAGSGGRTCAPIARRIYTALLERERAAATRTLALSD